MQLGDEELEQRLDAIPGVRSAAYREEKPITGPDAWFARAVTLQPARPRERIT